MVIELFVIFTPVCVVGCLWAVLNGIANRRIDAITR